MSSGKAMAIGSLLVLCLVGGCSTLVAEEGTPRASMNVHSVWQGTCDQTGMKPYPMILFIKNRQGDAFQGTTCPGGSHQKVSSRLPRTR